MLQWMGGPSADKARMEVARVVWRERVTAAERGDGDGGNNYGAENPTTLQVENWNNP